MALVEAKQKYDQVSFIGLDGRELLRINNEAGAPRIVPPGELQNKFRRYYFTEALFLAKGQIYISPLDLNLEQGRVKRPLKPMVRLVTPLVRPQRQPEGHAGDQLPGQCPFRPFSRTT